MGFTMVKPSIIKYQRKIVNPSQYQRKHDFDVLRLIGDMMEMNLWNKHEQATQNGSSEPYARYMITSIMLAESFLYCWNVSC